MWWGVTRTTGGIRRPLSNKDLCQHEGLKKKCYCVRLKSDVSSVCEQVT